jgi:hypothetical protein
MTSDTPDRGLQWIFPAAALIALVLVFVLIHHFRGEEQASPLERGLLWLAKKQHDDGSWRGEEIAVLRPGPAMTAFVLYSMTRLPEKLRGDYSERMNRAARYLESQINADGIVGMTTEGPDYPNYATALTVLAFASLKPAGADASVARMVAYLKRAQLDETEGWTRAEPEYGGWAFGGPPQPKPNAHRLDISMTRFALEALSAAAVPADDPAWDRARKFLAECQNFGRGARDDGGFRFTTLRPSQNKAGEDGSYGSATADGLISLRAARGSKDRIDAAEAWIRSRFTADRCPGFAPDHPRPWADSLLGYWLASVGRLADASGKTAIARVLIVRQRQDGSWVNPSDLMLENEPILATTLAVLALSETTR